MTSNPPAACCMVSYQLTALSKLPTAYVTRQSGIKTGGRVESGEHGRLASHKLSAASRFISLI